MNEDIKKHYQQLFAQHGDSPDAVQYSDRITQFKRFEVLSQVAHKLNSVVDIGCGLGHFYEYLKEGQPDVKYLGLDFVDEFIEASKTKYADNERTSFKQFDLTKDVIPAGYDYVVLSGVFNNKSSNNNEFMLNGINSMFNACTKGIAFNAMSTYVDFQADNLYYTDPLEIFDYCKRNLSRKVTLRHDYLVKENSIPFEYCIYVYKCLSNLHQP